MSIEAKATGIPNRSRWSLLSPCQSGDEGKGAMAQLKKDVRGMGHGLIHLLARWQAAEDAAAPSEAWESECLFVPQMGHEEAVELGAKYNAATVVVKEGDVCQEIATHALTDEKGTPYSKGDAIQKLVLSRAECLSPEDVRVLFEESTFALGRMSEKKGTFRLKELFEVEAPRASVFSSSARYKKLL